MKIKTVHILNFKNFEGKHRFDLNEDINIFYAENGFGKSSFFDALEWCLTGEINRFKEYDDFNDDDIINYNLNDDIHNCSVKIDFSNGSIERGFNVENLRKKGKTQVKVEYKDENGNVVKSNGKKHINNLIKNRDCLGINSLTNIKQTHILSQDQITNFINAENPKERYQNVLSIMGIENKLLIDNLKDITKRLHQNIDELQCKVDEYDNKQKKLLAEKKDIDKELLIDKISNLDLKEINSDVIVNSLNKNENIEEIHLDRNIKDKLKLNIIKYQEQLSIIANIEANKYKNIESFKKSNDETLEEINDLRYKIKSKFLVIENLEKKLSELLEKEKYFKNVINVKQEIKSKFEQIKKINISNIDIEGYSFINRELSIISYTIKHKLELDNYTLMLQKYINEKNELELNIEKVLENQEINKNRIKDIENNLTGTDIKELVDMIDSLEKIKKSLVKKESINSCPVCSSDVTSIDIIKEIEKNIDVYKGVTSKLEYVSKELISSKDSLLKKLDFSYDNLKVLKTRLNLSIDKIEDLTEKIKIIIENRFYREDLFNNDIGLLKLTEKNMKDKLEDISNYNKIKKEIEVLENKYKEDLDLIGDGTKDITDILIKLKTKLNNENKEILEMKELENKLESKLKDNNRILYKLDKSILDKKYNTDTNQLKIEMKKQIEYIENVIKDIEYIHSSIENYLFNISKDKEVKELIKARDKYKKSVTLIQEKVENIKSYVNSLNSYSKQCIEKYLNDSKSPVKKYYNYLNPMPIKQSLHFNTNNEDEKLLIEIKYNEKPVIRLANKILSSGQLNVLALSIFLAMNEHQRMNNLNMIAIDDPIQNMDDINQFSVCDILGNIQTQMIFSTHDIEFLKLFLKKNSYKKGSIKIFNMESPYLTPDKVKIIDNN